MAAFESTKNSAFVFVKPHAVTEATKAMVKEEVLDMARKLGAAGLNLLVIDTENKFISTGVAKEIADAAGGKYYYLPNADERVVASATMEALADLKSG